jgi:hypothetical protein
MKAIQVVNTWILRLTAEELSMLSSYLVMSVSLYVHLFIRPLVLDRMDRSSTRAVQPCSRLDRSSVPSVHPGWWVPDPNPGPGMPC